ncbi:MAG TPA: adenylate kinase [Acidimicrobiales bacterium]|nr:adenylate kinase [Acidimicrobiales bacterium]
MVLGKQGAGKGTQADRLARHYGIPHVSTGDMFRASVKDDTEAGRRVKTYMEHGELVPDEVVIDVVAERLDRHDVGDEGFVLDGFPRNVAQAEALDEMLGEEGVDLVLELQVPTDVVLARLEGRRVCTGCGKNYSVENPPAQDWICDRCGSKVVPRHDDTETAIKRRLAVYEKQTEPLVAWYMAKDKLAAVDGTGAPDTVTTRLLRAAESRLAEPADPARGRR